MPIFNDNAESIGRTPLVKINRLAKGLPGTVLGKIEGRNPAYSVKCRIGASMIWDAEKTGKLKSGMKVVEPTSGNTGIALAYVCAAKGYSLTLTMPETMSMERRQMLKAFGAEIILTPGAEGMRGALKSYCSCMGPIGGAHSRSEPYLLKHIPQTPRSVQFISRRPCVSSMQGILLARL